MTVSGRRIIPAVLGVLITSVAFSAALPLGSASAAQITSRSLTLEAVGTTGGSTPGGTVNHHFKFTAPSSTTVKSIKFTYCTQARTQSCTAPTAMDASTATLGTNNLTGWSMSTKTANSVILTFSTGSDLSSLSPVDVILDSVKNTTATNTAFYVDITSYTSTDASTGATDDGWVAAATANQIQLSGTMPESLIFCTGDTITLNSGVPDCSTATNATVTFNQLFSPTDTATATSVMAASTNASSGYVITYSGATLTSGSNTITPMSSATTGVKGTSQFGMNLKLNTTATSSPAVGAEITPASNGTNLRGEPKPSSGYDVADNFKFTTSGDAVADSANGGASGTDSQLYTVSYIVNVDGAQGAGTYTTTLTYICTPTF